MIKKEIYLFQETLNEKGLKYKEEQIKEILRVKMTQDALRKTGFSQDEIYSTFLYETMKRISEKELGHFPGDETFFNEIYTLGQNIDLVEFLIEVDKNDRDSIIVASSELLNYWQTFFSSEKEQSVLMPEAEKNLLGLKKLISQAENSQFTLTSQMPLMFLALKLIFAEFSNVKVELSSLYQSKTVDQQYDLIISLPDFSLKFENMQKYLTRESEGRAVENLLPQLKDSGQLLVVVPARFTFSSGGFANLRAKILANYSLEEIVLLPNRILLTTMIKPYCLIISQQKKDSLKLRQLEKQDNHLVVEKEKEIPLVEFVQNGTWPVEYFFIENSEELEKYSNSAVKKVKLKDVAEIFRGKSISKKYLEPGQTYILNIMDIQNNEISFEQMDSMVAEQRKIAKYQLFTDDLILTCRGTTLKMAVFPVSQKQVIASANVMVFRFNKEVLSTYVKIFLDSQLGRTLIKTYQRGTIIKNINEADIAEMEIPLLPLAEQEQIVAKYLAEKNHYQTKIEEATERWTKCQQDLLAEILG